MIDLLAARPQGLGKSSVKTGTARENPARVALGCYQEGTDLGGLRSGPGLSNLQGPGRPDRQAGRTGGGSKESEKGTSGTVSVHPFPVLLEGREEAGWKSGATTFFLA